MGHQPLLHRRLLLFFVQELVALVHNIHSQARFVLTGPRAGNPTGGLRLSLLLGITLFAQGVHLFPEQLLLFVVGPVRRADHRVQSCRPAVVHHLLQSGIDPAVNGVSAFEFGQFRNLKILRQRMRGTDQTQLPGIFFLCRFRHLSRYLLRYLSRLQRLGFHRRRRRSRQCLHRRFFLLFHHGPGSPQHEPSQEQHQSQQERKQQHAAPAAASHLPILCGSHLR